MSATALLVLGVVWPVAGELASLPAAPKLARELAQAGAELVPAEQAWARLDQALEPRALPVTGSQIDQLRQQLLAGSEAFLYQDYPRARGALEAAREQSRSWLGQATRQHPELLADYLEGVVTLVRTLQAMGDEPAAEALLEAIAFRFPELRLTEAEVPRTLLVRLAEAQRRLALRMGALDVKLLGDLPREVGGCGIYMNGVLRGYPPLRLDAVYAGSYRISVLCPGRPPSRPLRVEIGEGRSRLLVFVRGDGQLVLGPEGRVGVRLASGWSGPGPVPMAGRALAARVGAAGALLVGPDAAYDGLRVRLVWRQGASPGAGMKWGSAEDVLALIRGHGLQGESQPSPLARGLLWVAAGLASGAVLAGGLAGWSYRSFEHCQRSPSCESSPGLVEHKQAVERFALTADILLIAALVSGGSAGFLWGTSPSEQSP